MNLYYNVTVTAIKALSHVGPWIQDICSGVILTLPPFINFFPEPDEMFGEKYILEASVWDGLMVDPQSNGENTKCPTQDVVDFAKLKTFSQISHNYLLFSHNIV